MFKQKKKKSNLKKNVHRDEEEDDIPDDDDSKPTFEAPKQSGKSGMSFESSVNKRKEDDKIVHSTLSEIMNIEDSSRVNSSVDPNIRNKRNASGPMRITNTIRATITFDYQPDICKDWYETGYCTYGDNCKFMHVREDFKTGWQIEKSWEEKQKRIKEALKERIASGKSTSELKKEEEEEKMNEEFEGKFPFACLICKKRFKNPVVTQCNHYFCERCALEHYRTSGQCAYCEKPTHGIFNTAYELMTDKANAWLDRVWKKREEEEEEGEEEEEKGKEREEKEEKEKDKEEGDGKEEKKENFDDKREKEEEEDEEEEKEKKREEEEEEESEHFEKRKRPVG